MTITGKDHQEHLDHLEEVLKGLKEYGFKSKLGEMQILSAEDHLLWTRSESRRGTQNSRES